MTHDALVFDRIGAIDILRTPWQADRVTIVLLHGFGADFKDLSSLKNVWDPDHRFNWIFPNGILEISLGYMGTGRAWFPLNMELLEERFKPGSPHNFAQHLPQGLDEAADQIATMISQMEIDPKKLILGGFSQGAMVSCHSVARGKLNPRGMLQLSSTLICQDMWKQGFKESKNLKILQSHGRFDPVLPYASAIQLKELFEQAKLDIEFIDFPGGHEIPYSLCENIKQFIHNLSSH